MSEASAGNVSHDALWAPDSASPAEQLLLPAPDPLPTDGDSPADNSDLVAEPTEGFHEPEGGPDDAIATNVITSF